MKLEVGKKYVTRNGQVVRILATDFNAPFPIVGAVLWGKNEFIQMYMANGNHNTREESNLDIVSEYLQPREWWISKKDFTVYHAISYSEEENYVHAREVLE